MNNHDRILKITISALFLALAFILPFFTGQIPQIGSMLLPMHIPVILCGFICGWPYGLLIGLLAPLSRSLLLGMPPFFPTALCMAFELMAYGAFSGYFYKRLPKNKLDIYLTLLIAMVLGRIVWGLAMFLCMSITNNTFTLAAFYAGAIGSAIPGIILQIVIIPILVMIIRQTKVSGLNV